MPKRPFLLYGLVIVFLLSAIASTLGLIGTIRTWNWLIAIEGEVLPTLLILKNIFFALGGFTAAFLLWMRFSWAPLLGGVFSLVSKLWFWLERVILTKNPLPFSRHILILCISLFFLILVLISLYLLVPFMRLGAKLPEPQSILSEEKGDADEKAVT
ncbi:MAG: hypothetical protein NTZ74_13170 [Chloroflexi bacterium]|nr:hypothetical protein [Chloroflexota bacterium]